MWGGAMEPVNIMVKRETIVRYGAGQGRGADRGRETGQGHRAGQGYGASYGRWACRGRRRGAGQGHKAVALVMTACAIICAIVLALPALAFADSYPHVRISADVQASGDVRVTETRGFEFSDDGNGVYWNIPESYNEQGGLSRITVTDVRVGAEGDTRGTSFSQVSSASLGDSGVYTVERSDGMVQLMVYEPHSEDGVQQVTVSYTLQGAVMAWADTAELYWQFVGPDWEENSQDVMLIISFPNGSQDAERAVRGKNFRAWGHGPLDGTVEPDATVPEVRYSVPVVSSGTYAEARVAFPLAWVPELVASGTGSSEERLSTIVSEEEAWAREANERRERQRSERMVQSIVMVAVSGVFALVLAVVKATHRSPVPHFGETYLDELPSHDHPAVIAAFDQGGTVNERAFASTLIKLTAEGAVGIDGPGSQPPAAEGGPIAEGEPEYGDRPPSRAYGLRLLDPARREEASIDGAALRLFFRSNRPAVSFDSMSDYAGDNPERYRELVDDFTGEVDAALSERGLIASTGKTGSVVSLVAGGAILVGVLVVGVVGELWIPMVISVALTLIGMVLGCTLKRLTPEGAELRARCDAFVRWLKEYEARDCAAPSDPAQWGDILVYAVALGLDSELVRDLARLIPSEAVVAGGYYPMYWWYIPHGRHHTSPLDRADTNSAITPAALASSANSSGSGFGGGFSGGGGGGVGGGGGGSF